MRLHTPRLLDHCDWLIERNLLINNFGNIITPFEQCMYYLKQMVEYARLMDDQKLSDEVLLAKILFLNRYDSGKRYGK